MRTIRAEQRIDECEGALSLARDEGDGDRRNYLSGYLDGLRAMQKIFSGEPFLKVGDTVRGAMLYGKTNTLTGRISNIVRNEMGPRWDTVFIDWVDERGNPAPSAAFHRKDIEDRT